LGDLALSARLVDLLMGLDSFAVGAQARRCSSTDRAT